MSAKILQLKGVGSPSEERLRPVIFILLWWDSFPPEQAFNTMNCAATLTSSRKLLMSIVSARRRQSAAESKFYCVSLRGRE